LTVSLVDFFVPDFFASIAMRWLTPGPDSDRATGPFVSPNILGIVAGIVVIVGAVQALTMGKRWWLWAAFTALAGVALLASFSRGALLGLVIAGAAVLALRSRRAAAVYLAVLALAAVIAVPIYLGARGATSGGSAAAALANDQGRIDAWLAGIRMIVAEPIFGHGFLSFRQLGESFGATDGLKTSHNEFIGLWAGSGVVALASYVVLIAGVIACALERKSDSWARVAIGALTLFLVAVSFSDALNFLAATGPMWLVVAYGIGRPLAASSLDPPP
jgi:O-antigen ligase